MNLAWSRALQALCGALVLFGLASCGGGDQVGSFSPRRVIAFGDEASVITSQGLKYTVNGATNDCTVNPNWVMVVANAYGLSFSQCNPTRQLTTSINYASVGATVADVVQQIDRHLGGDNFSGTDLVTIMVGANDILQQYRLFPQANESALAQELQTRGATLGAQVRRIAELGGKVLIVTTVDQGVTPFALDEQAHHSLEGDRAALLRRLSKDFNDEVRAGVGELNDGSKIGFVAGDELSDGFVSNPGLYGFANTTQAACAKPLPTCTVNTLVPNASGDTWVWADSLLLSAGGNRQLGSTAYNRAHNNPF